VSLKRTLRDLYNDKNMYQRDFILRMIEMIARLIAGILKLIKTGELNQASQALQNAYGVAFKHEALNLKTIPEEKLLATLVLEHQYTTGHLEMLAELFYAEAEILLAEKEITESISFYRKSLALYEYIDKDYRAYSQARQDRIQAIKDRITDESAKG
jgi:tetratricopeptide (TPR) repeat protein